MGEGRRLVDTAAAAVAVDRTPATIRKWVERGYLKRYGREGRRGLVDLDEVILTGRRMTGDTPRRPT